MRHVFRVVIIKLMIGEGTGLGIANINLVCDLSKFLSAKDLHVSLRQKKIFENLNSF